MNPAAKKDKKQAVKPAPAQPATTPAPAEQGPVPVVTAPIAEKPVVVKVVSQVVPEAPKQPTKAQTTLDKLKAGWAAKQIDLSKMTCTQDGSKLQVMVGEGWPSITIGKQGGVTVNELHSYGDPVEAAMDGLNLYKMQQERDAKRTAAKAVPPAVPEQPKQQTA